ncbi:MAG TPA: VOC family protein [Solirubrobacteraceae bacterium]|jgi:catechol 2,3-dioxygenase
MSTRLPTEAPRPGAAAELPASLRLGSVHIVVADLDRSVGWYQDVLGLRVHGAPGGGPAALGTGDGEPVLVLHERPGARPAGRHAGLYHYALLYPSREELARAALRLSAARVPVDGLSDHETHEAIYLSDPDGNGIELAADRPREQWPPSLGYAGGPKPLDVAALMATIEGEEPRRQAGPGLAVGHLHLHVGDVDEGLAFYRDVIGFALMARIGDSAAFVAAGGYHHHLGFNVWRGRGVPPVPPDAVGLHHWTVVLDDAASVAAVRERAEAAGAPVERDGDGPAFTVHDPWGMALRFEVAA